MAVVLAAFVLGTWLLQQTSRLPSSRVTGVLLAAGALLVVAACWIAGKSRSADADRMRHGRGSALHRVAWRDAITRYGCMAACGVLLIGIGQAAWRAHLRLADQLAFADEGREFRVRGCITGLPVEGDYGVRFEFDVLSESPGSSSVRSVPSRIVLSWAQPPVILRPTQRWDLSVRLRRPHGALNGSGFDVEAWLFAEGLRATGAVVTSGHASPPERLADDPTAGGAHIDRIRDRLREALQTRLQGLEHGGVLIALAIGDQRAIDAEKWALFSRTGIAHLVSISGLHITMIAALAAAAGRSFWRRGPRWLHRWSMQSFAACLAVLAALGYCLLAGWGVPAQRTFLMIAIVALAQQARCRMPSATVLGIAAASVCALDPWAVTAAGFWLSFGAVAALLFVGSAVLHRPVGIKAMLHAAARTQAAVTVALLPLTVVLFQQVSLVSPLANAIAIPVVSYVVTPLALLGAATAALPGPGASLASVALHAAHAVFAALMAVLRGMDGWPLASVNVASPPSWLLAPALLGALWLMAAGWPARPLACLWMAPMFVWPSPRPAAGAMWVTALDVGQGSAIMVESHDARLLFDTGPRFNADADAGARIVLPWLRSRGIGHLDAVVVSHLDADHSGGFRSLRAAVPMGQVRSSVHAANAALGNINPLPQRCEAGQDLSLGALHVEVLQPVASDYARSLSTNARSCVMRISVGSNRVLLTGDLPAQQERELVLRAGHQLPADVLIAPHHGSVTSSTDELLAAVQPRWVGIQVGYRSRYGHPHATVINRYKAHGLMILRSDHDGAVQWRFDQTGAVVIERYRRDHARYWHNQPADVPEAGSP